MRFDSITIWFGMAAMGLVILAGCSTGSSTECGGDSDCPENMRCDGKECVLAEDLVIDSPEHDVQDESDVADMETDAECDCGGLCSPVELCCECQCVFPGTDSMNCGGCGIECGPEQNCIDGNCLADGEEPAPCPGLEQRCGGECVDLKNSNDHCGVCFNPCGAGSPCYNWSCDHCQSGGIVCEDTCTFIDTDRDHCGWCGVECPDGTVCRDGQCTSECPPGQLLCDNFCIDPMVNNQHCGDCGQSCGAGELCALGSCTN